jgi:hypothetical protein
MYVVAGFAAKGSKTSYNIHSCELPQAVRSQEKKKAE